MMLYFNHDRPYTRAHFEVSVSAVCILPPITAMTSPRKIPQLRLLTQKIKKKSVLTLLVTIAILISHQNKSKDYLR